MIQEQNRLSTQQSQINLGKRKTLIQKWATILVLLSCILPFLNNILKNFFDTESVLLLNNPYTKKLDLDTAIFFFSMPISYAFIAIGGLFGAHKKSYYAVFISCYFQVALTTNYLFISKGKAFIYTEICIAILFIIVAVIYFLAQKYYKDLEIMIEFLNKTIDRYSQIIRKNTQKNEVDR